FDRAGIDIAILAARAVGVPGIVRVADEGSILSVLDLGATGVLVPHVATGAQARRVADACRYRGGRRGFANTTRAGRYGLAGMAQTGEAAVAAVPAFAWIEDREALDNLDAIPAPEGIEGVFLGRGDLAVAMGETAMDAPPVRQATERIAASARRAGKAIFGV